jgi:peptidoglycan L-alanyl-D-glutamate endopeptidase CwlK
MAFKLSQRSRKRLEGVHSDLVAVVELAIIMTPVDFTVIEGRRTPERQRELYRAGATKTLNSRHLTGHAVDLAPLVKGQVRWDWPLFHQLAPAVKDAAQALGVRIEWGGDWPRFPDGPHFELSRAAYPA